MASDNTFKNKQGSPVYLNNRDEQPVNDARTHKQDSGSTTILATKKAIPDEWNGRVINHCIFI